MDLTENVVGGHFAFGEGPTLPQAYHTGSGDQYNVSGNAVQFSATGTAQQYVAHGPNSQLTINYASDNKDIIERMMELKQMLIQTQSLHSAALMSLHSAALVNTNQKVSIVQFNQMLDSLSRETKRISPESSQELKWERSRLSDINPFWLRPKFQTWGSKNESSLVFLRGSYQTRNQVKGFCMDIIRLVNEAKLPILWALKPRESEGSSGCSCEEIMKSLALQAMRTLAQHIDDSKITEERLSLIYKKFKSARTESEWIHLLGEVISIWPWIYIIVDVHLLTRIPPLHQELMTAFLRLTEDLQRKHAGTAVKILLVSYGGAMFDENSSARFKDVLVPVLQCAKRGASGPGRRQTVVGRGLLGRFPNRARGWGARH